jgi:hypothetical protein
MATTHSGIGSYAGEKNEHDIRAQWLQSPVAAHGGFENQQQHILSHRNCNTTQQANECISIRYSFEIPTLGPHARPLLSLQQTVPSDAKNARSHVYQRRANALNPYAMLLCRCRLILMLVLKKSKPRC